MYSKEYTYDTYKNTVITKYQILITNPPAPQTWSHAPLKRGKVMYQGESIFR